MCKAQDRCTGSSTGLLVSCLFLRKQGPDGTALLLRHGQQTTTHPSGRGWITNYSTVGNPGKPVSLASTKPRLSITSCPLSRHRNAQTRDRVGPGQRQPGAQVSFFTLLGRPQDRAQASMGMLPEAPRPVSPLCQLGKPASLSSSAFPKGTSDEMGTMEWKAQGRLQPVLTTDSMFRC